MLLLFLLGLSTSFAAQTSTSSPARTDYRNFEIIPKKNIFNPRRSPAYVPSERPQTIRRRTETLALVGVMSYGKGPMAFFEGTRSDYRKVLKPNDSIAGFKVAAIEPSSVKLVANTNEIELQLGMQLAREEEGDWKLSMRPESLDTGLARATPMRSASQVNSERDSASDPNANNPFGAIGNFFANGGFRGGGNGFPGAVQTPQAQPAVTPVPSSQQAAPANESADTILQRLAARRAQETGEPQQGQQIEPRLDQRPEVSPNQPGQSQPNQQIELPNPGTEQPQPQPGEPVSQPPNQ